MSFSPSSRMRLTERDLDRFPGATLFDRLARTICRAGCLPRKELYEAWQIARRVRRHFRGGRVVDVAGGHGLLAQVMLLLDGSSPGALVVDTALPPSSVKVQAAVAATWPAIAGRVVFAQCAFDEVKLDPTDLVVSSHACGALTDHVLRQATAARARVAVLPCCHDLRRSRATDLIGWLDGPLAIDVERAVWLRQQGYRIWTQTIPDDISPKNRLLFGAPRLDAPEKTAAGSRAGFSHAAGRSRDQRICAPLLKPLRVS